MNLIEWKKEQQLISSRFEETRGMLADIQQALVDDAGNIDLQEEDRLARHQLDHLSKAEESMYKQRSRDLSVNLGDGNTKYFYNLMRTRHANSFISQITDKEGNIFADREGISAVFVSHFSDILAPIKNANPNKAPGPDGFNAHFFKICWPIIGNDICAGIIDFFKHGSLLKQLKATFIVLVPKGENVSTPDKFWPISLRNDYIRLSVAFFCIG